MAREKPEGKPYKRLEASFEASTKDPENFNKWPQDDRKSTDDKIEDNGEMMVGDHA